MSKKWTQLIELRIAAGLSQQELADRLGISRSRLGNYELGERRPDLELLSKLADFFRVPVDQLLGRPDEVVIPPEVIPPEWREFVNNARARGYSVDQVQQALALIESIRRQEKTETKKEREN